MVLMPILTLYISFHLNPAKYTPFSRLESFISIYHRAGRGRYTGALSCIHVQSRVLTVGAAITVMTAMYRQYPWGICSRVLTGFPSSRIVTINFKTRVHFSRLLRLLGNLSEEETIEGAVYTRLGRPRLHYPCIHAYPRSNDRPQPPKY